MRPALLLVLVMLPEVAAAQSQAPGTTTTGEVQRQLPTSTPAPVPAITPPTAQGGALATVPERIAPPGVGNNLAGPANATPFSSTPTDAMPASRGGAAPDPSR